MRILSQASSSSGYERKWSTFAHIHTKVRNQLNYAKLEKLVFAQYNMRLKLKFLANEDRESEFKPIDLSNVFEEDEGISEWLDDPGDILLDELGDNGQPTKPNTFLATWANHYSDNEACGIGQSQSSMPLPPRRSTVGYGGAGSSTARHSTSNQNAPLTLSSDDGDDDDDDGNNDGDGGNDDTRHDGDSGIHFTEEQGFTHATQDKDHGFRRLRQYDRGERRRLHSRDEQQNLDNLQAIDSIMRGVDMINSGLSDMSMSDYYSQGSSSGRHSYGHGSLSTRQSYGQGSGYHSLNRGSGYHSYDQGSSSRYQSYGYEPSSYGYGSAYDSQASSSHSYGLGHGYGQIGGRLGAPPTERHGCSMEEFQRYKANYEAWYCNYMSWGDYCRYIQNTYHVFLSAYLDPGSVYVSIRHSTTGWM
ncbi:Ribonuclease H-like domain protein [Actinidia chinensis var. chinensis]|uniref:Ribonuclease H-like domain protein n=1 Tax=Actinidia chinensis var. chinensis TaxID=1590841 RepID=A0A2R6QID7_ACTCC|nr:Ribonuclease H-like domain protein [Actinidia chinensis var. chinensis]